MQVHYVDSAPEASAGYRYGDNNPFYGGASIYKASGGSACTSAFAVYNTESNPSFNQAMLTADHCGSTGEEWRSGYVNPNSTTPTNWSIGSLISGNSGGSDVRRILGPNKTYEGRVYFGANNTGNYTSIKGWAYPITGDTLCPTGAYSGANCLAKVISTGGTKCYVGGSCYNNLATVQSTSDAPLFGNGDSGGPVVGSSRIGTVAVAIISGISTGGSNQVSCSGIPTQDGHKCSKLGYVASLRAFFDNNSTWRIKIS